jgi:hypothetical protein
MNKKLLPWLTTFCALGLGGTAAYYSIIGLSKLFAGTAIAVIIMASFLEISKLTLAILLHSYWPQLNKLFKIYYLISLTILSLITSAGIYGMLSSGYQSTANKEGIATQQITALETKKKLYEQTRDNIIQEKQSLANLKNTLSKGSVTQYTDKKGNLVVRSNNSSIKQIESANKTEEKLTYKLDIVNDSIFALENKILETKVFNESSSELGPLKYLSNLLGVSMDKIVNWLLLIIIFVFDPLAISLVIAANFAFSQLLPKKEYPLEEKIEDMKRVVDAYDSLEKEVNEQQHHFLDLDKDGVVEAEEIEAVINQVSAIGNSFTTAEGGKKAALNAEVQKLKDMILSTVPKSKKNNDNTITYF